MLCYAKLNLDIRIFVCWHKLNLERVPRQQEDIHSFYGRHPFSGQRQKVKMSVFHKTLRPIEMKRKIKHFQNCFETVLKLFCFSFTSVVRTLA